MAQKADFIKDLAVKRFIVSKKLRSTDQAVDQLAATFNAVLETVILEAAKIARKQRKKTISPEHIALAVKKHVGKKDLDWNEILPQLLEESPADLGKIAKGVRDYISKHGPK
jgi:histone H3/H4